MTGMKLRRVMLDGALIGAELTGDIELKASETHKIRKLLLANGGEEREGGLSVTVVSKSAMVISLRLDYHRKGLYYLNMSGNPLKFLTGRNDYGFAEADRVIITAYRKALEALEGSIPPRILRAIAERQINVHSLEFATYTNKVKDKQQLINDWAHVYRTAYSSKDGLTHRTLADMLNLRFTRAHKDHSSSICLRILSGDGREDEAMLQCYDKALEIRDKAKEFGIVALVEADIEDRIRIELSLTRGWFRRRQVNGKKLNTLGDLCAYIKKNHDGSWPSFLEKEFLWAIKRTHLFDMWAFDALKAMGDSSAVGHAMVKARALLRVTDAEWNALIRKKKMVATNLNPHPYKIELDMGTPED